MFFTFFLSFYSMFYPSYSSQDSRQYCMYNQETQRFMYPTVSDILSKRIVISTFTTALMLGQYGCGKSGLFTHILLDEAAQVRV